MTNFSLGLKARDFNPRHRRQKTRGVFWRELPDRAVRLCKIANRTVKEEEPIPSVFEESPLLQTLQRAVVVKLFGLRFSRARICRDGELHHIYDRFARHLQVQREMLGKGLVGFFQPLGVLHTSVLTVILLANGSLDFIRRVAS